MAVNKEKKRKFTSSSSLFENRSSFLVSTTTTDPFAFSPPPKKRSKLPLLHLKIPKQADKTTMGDPEPPTTTALANEKDIFHSHVVTSFRRQNNNNASSLSSLEADHDEENVIEEEEFCDIVQSICSAKEIRRLQKQKATGDDVDFDTACRFGIDRDLLVDLSDAQCPFSKWTDTNIKLWLCRVPMIVGGAKEDLPIDSITHFTYTARDQRFTMKVAFFSKASRKKKTAWVDVDMLRRSDAYCRLLKEEYCWYDKVALQFIRGGGGETSDDDKKRSKRKKPIATKKGKRRRPGNNSSSSSKDDEDEDSSSLSSESGGDDSDDYCGGTTSQHSMKAYLSYFRSRILGPPASATQQQQQKRARGNK